jgi:hypothetical protein
MSLRARTVCGSVAGRGARGLLILERLVDDPLLPEPRIARTIVAGLAPRGTTAVVLVVSGVERRLAVSRRTGAYLAILPGSSRRRDLLLRIEGRRRLVFDFARGSDSRTAFLADTVRTELTAPDPFGGRRLALVSYRVVPETVFGPREATCTEPGRLVAGEAGPYDPAWGSFLDAPTRVWEGSFADFWPPAAVVPDQVGSCTVALDPEIDGPIEALGVKRFARRLVVVHGLLAPSVARLEVGDERGAHARAPVVSPGRAFLVPVESTGRFGARITLTAVLSSGARGARTVFLGPHGVPARWRSWEPRDGGRVLRVRWIGGFEPFLRVRARERGRTVTVVVEQRHQPDFDARGIRSVILDIGIPKCVDVRLRRPLGGRRVADGADGARRPLRRVRSARCRARP